MRKTQPPFNISKIHKTESELGLARYWKYKYVWLKPRWANFFTWELDGKSLQLLAGHIQKTEFIE